jgi:putative Ca2+/H+ antiporter (TMEM165/GDT1 family)
VLLLLLLAVAVAAAAGPQQDEWFEILDANSDGSIDRSEFQQGLEKLAAFLRQPLASAQSAESSRRPWTWIPESLTSLEGFWRAFTGAVAMIVATELGDKTFFIAAVLSMKHDRAAVFGGAFAALVIMTVLSTAMGLVLPALLSPQYTHVLGGILFLYFGFKLLSESRSMEAGQHSDELEEVEEELLQQSSKKKVAEKDIEEGGADKTPSSKKQAQQQQNHWYNIFVQSLTLTFVAEWGDRSQIATIALAAHRNAVGVTVGGCLGHCLCTGLAVAGGRMLAARISEKTVAVGGGIVFLLFGVHSLFFETE